MPAKHGMKGMERVDDRSGAAGGKLVKNYCGIDLIAKFTS